MTQRNASLRLDAALLRGRAELGSRPQRPRDGVTVRLNDRKTRERDFCHFWSQ